MNDLQSNRVASLFDLTDRVAIVTGGAGLLGYHHAAILASSGARVILLDLLPRIRTPVHSNLLKSLVLRVSASYAISLAGESFPHRHAGPDALERFNRVDIFD